MIEKIEDIISNEFRIPIKYINSKDRFMEYVEPRHLIWWLALHYSPMTIPRIAERYNRDRATIYYGIDNVTNKRKVDNNYRIRFEKLKEVLKY